MSFLINEVYVWIGDDDQLIWRFSMTDSMILTARVHPLIFHPSFLAIEQMQGQQSFFPLRRYFTQLISAVWSAPFSLAAFSQAW